MANSSIKLVIYYFHIYLCVYACIFSGGGSVVVVVVAAAAAAALVFSLRLGAERRGFGYVNVCECNVMYDGFGLKNQPSKQAGS